MTRTCMGTPRVTCTEKGLRRWMTSTFQGNSMTTRCTISLCRKSFTRRKAIFMNKKNSLVIWRMQIWLSISVRTYSRVPRNQPTQLTSKWAPWVCPSQRSASPRETQRKPNKRLTNKPFTASYQSPLSRKPLSQTLPTTWTWSSLPLEVMMRSLTSPRLLIS